MRIYTPAAYALLAMFNGVSNAADLPDRMGILSSTDYLPGCACVLFVNEDENKPFLLSGYRGTAKGAWVNIDGKDVLLERTSLPPPAEWRDGLKITEEYKLRDVWVKVRYAVVDDCEPKGQCDGWSVKTAVSTQFGPKEGRVEAKGWCGC